MLTRTLTWPQLFLLFGIIAVIGQTLCAAANQGIILVGEQTKFRVTHEIGDLLLFDKLSFEISHDLTNWESYLLIANEGVWEFSSPENEYKIAGQTNIGEGGWEIEFEVPTDTEAFTRLGIVEGPFLIDADATEETRNLYQNLNAIAPDQTLFGHQESLAYGVRWARYPSRSDVKDVTGSFPALYGWDFSGFGNMLENPASSDSNYTNLLRWTREGHERGGVATFAWHQINPVTRDSFYDTTEAVYSILPGGSNHAYYRELLDRVAEFFHELEGIPIIFRPYHEHNGDWFWWGKAHCSEEEYIALWRFTVEYLRDEKDVHNAIYAFSPDRGRIDLANAETDYFYGYPGDEYVDIIGLDDYGDVGRDTPQVSLQEQARRFVRSLELITTIAMEKGKVAALTETGLENIPIANWWTNVFLNGINANEQSRRIAYAQVWRNANFLIEDRYHYYAPFPGQISAENFIQFKEDESILFEDELPDLYRSYSRFERANE